MTSKENQAIATYLNASGVKHAITATTGGGHVSGSYHWKEGTDGQGLATDVAESIGDGKRDTPELLAIFKVFAPVESQLAELFYSGADHYIKRGVKYPISALDPTTRANHHDHVHVAVELGKFIQYPKTPQPTTGGFKLNGETFVAQCGFDHPKYGPSVANVKSDGAVFCTPKEAYLGGMNGDSDFKGRTAKGIRSNKNHGYTVIGSPQGEYGFNYPTGNDPR